MGPQAQAAELLATVLVNEGAEVRADGLVYLSGPRLFVQVRPTQVMEEGPMTMFMGTITTSLEVGRFGATVTVVGVGVDLRSAVGEALAHWLCGTLPVFLFWRGRHDCLTSPPGEIVTKGGRFTVLRGPLTARGVGEGESPQEGPDRFYWGPLSAVLETCRLLPRVHWFELFASKGASDEVEATCNWGNKGWVNGDGVLREVAKTWPPTDQPMRSFRQFIMLLPQGADQETLTAPTLWQRLRQRA